jgi:hypothetical protein
VACCADGYFGSICFEKQEPTSVAAAADVGDVGDVNDDDDGVSDGAESVRRKKGPDRIEGIRETETESNFVEKSFFA